ncbi:MAG: DUF1569 domain-containing protein [Lishizhenia sp.]
MFIENDLGVILSKLDTLTANKQPNWGTMTAQRMVEHLTDTLRIAVGENIQSLALPEEKLPGMLRFLESDKEMMKNVEVAFAKKDTPLRNEALDLAIDEYTDAYLNFIEFYEKFPEKTNLHPYYGPLNYQQWNRLNSKHITHHFKQFDIY